MHNKTNTELPQKMGNTLKTIDQQQDRRKTIKVNQPALLSSEISTKSDSNQSAKYRD